MKTIFTVTLMMSYLLLSCFIATPIATKAAGPNLLVNGSLDTWDSNTDVNGWIESGVDSYCTINENSTHVRTSGDGARCVLMNQTGTTSLELYQDVSVTGGVDYTAEVYVWMITSGEGHIEIMENPPSTTTSTAYITTSTSDYEMLTISATLGASTTTVRITIYYFTNFIPARALFDDATFYETSGTPEMPAFAISFVFIGGSLLVVVGTLAKRKRAGEV